jgi:hypothetical protein
MMSVAERGFSSNMTLEFQNRKRIFYNMTYRKICGATNARLECIIIKAAAVLAAWIFAAFALSRRAESSHESRVRRSNRHLPIDIASRRHYAKDRL